MLNFLLIILVSLASILGNGLFRMGLQRAGLESLRPSYLLKNLPSVIFQPLIIAGFIIFATGAIIWFRVLTQEPLNRSYPVFIAFVSFFLVIVSFTLLREPIVWYRVLGSILILSGAILAFAKI